MKKQFFVIGLFLCLFTFAGKAQANLHIGIDLFTALFAPAPVIEEVVVIEEAPHCCCHCRHPVRTVAGHVAVPPRVCREVVVQERCTPRRAQYSNRAIRVQRR